MFDPFAYAVEEERKKKQTPSQQAAITNKQQASFDPFSFALSQEGKKPLITTPTSTPKPTIAPTSKPTPTPTPQSGFNLGGFLNNLGDTIKNAIVKAVPQLQPGNKPTMPTPSVPSVNQIKTPTQPIKTLDNTTPTVSGASATMTPVAQMSPTMQNFQRTTKNIIDSVMKFNPIDSAITVGQNALAKQAENYSTGKKDTLPPLVYSLAFYQDASNKILNAAPAPVQNILKGHISAVNSTLLGSSEIMNKTLNEKFAAPKDIAGQRFYSVGQILGSVNTFLAGGMFLKAAGVTKLSMPILLNAVSQLSAKPGTTFLQRIEKIPNDTIAGWLASMIPGSDKFFSTKTFVGAGQTGAVFYLNSFVNSLIEGLPPEKAAEVANQAGLVGALFHTGSVALGRTGAKLFGEQKAGEYVLTPEQTLNQAEGTNLKGTPAGDYLKGKAIEAQEQGKNLNVEIVAQRQGKLIKGEGLIPKLGEKVTTKIGEAIGTEVITTPDGVGFRATLVDAPAPIQQLKGETPSVKTPEVPTIAIVPGATAEPQVPKINIEVKPTTNLQTTIENKITEQGGKIENISKDSQGYTTIMADNVKISFDEKQDTIDIVGFKGGETRTKGDPTKLLDQIKEYASSQDKSITATKITGGDIEYWKKVGFTPIDISGGKGTQFEAIWEKSSTSQTDIKPIESMPVPGDQSNKPLPTKETTVAPIKETVQKRMEEIKVAKQIQDNKPPVEQSPKDIPSNTNAQTPIGTGDVTKSKAYTRVFDRLSEEVRQDVNYNKLNLKQDTENALNFITKDPQRALRVGLGIEQPPAGQTETAIAIALADKAGRDGDYSLQSQLEASRSLRQTRRGQEIVSERGRFDETSPHTYIRELMDRRLKNLGSNLKGALKNAAGKVQSVKEAAMNKIDVEVEKIKRKIQKDRNKIKLAQDIIDSIIC